MKAIRAKDAVIAKAIYYDVSKLQLSAIDVSSFKVLSVLFLKKWNEYTFANDEVKQLVNKFLVYWRGQWLEKEGVENWYQAANPQVSFTNSAPFLTIFNILASFQHSMTNNALESILAPNLYFRPKE